MPTPRDNPRLERVPTGITNLDIILDGGFIRGGIYIVQGMPGAGKTILANQICFNHVARGRRAIYVTLLAESHARMLLNLEGMQFFDPAAVPKSIYYVSAFHALETEGLKGLLDVIRREVRAHDASVLVLDGLVAAEELAKTDQELKKFIQELQNQNSLSSCTTLLLTSGGAKTMRPERTMVDGLIELTDQLFSTRRERRLEVTKFRGGPFLRGQHSFQITNRGIEVYPRLESLLARPLEKDACVDQRVSAGVAALDKMLGGGLPCGTTTMLIGPSGCGKTTLGLHFMSASTPEAPGIYLSFYETPERACRKAACLGLDLAARLKSGAVEYIWRPTTENILDAIGNDLLAALMRRKVARLFIDGMDGFRQAALNVERVVPFAVALSNECRAREITTLYTAESNKLSSAEVEVPITGISAMVENLLLMRYVERDSRAQRLLSVLKVRDSAFDPLLREFSITDHGIEVGGAFTNTTGLLASTARRATAKDKAAPRKAAKRKGARRK